MKPRWIVMQGIVAGLLIGSVAGFTWNSRPYVSTAALRAVVPTIPARFAPVQKIDLDQMLPQLTAPVLSRERLGSVIQQHGLYGRELTVLPLADLIETMRTQIQFRMTSENIVAVSFSYPDRNLASDVAKELAGLLVQEFHRTRVSEVEGTVQFLRDQVTKAAVTWDENIAKLRSAPEQTVHRVWLDADLARAQYETLNAKLAEAEMIRDVERRQQGPALEFVDAASLPEEHRPSTLLSAVLGSAAGGLLGWLFSRVGRWRMRRLSFTAS